jgi:hypothetical protein
MTRLLALPLLVAAGLVAGPSPAQAGPCVGTHPPVCVPETDIWYNPPLGTGCVTMTHPTEPWKEIKICT